MNDAREESNFRAHLLDATLSSSNQFDNAVLTLSSAFLALSIAFIKDIVPLNSAAFMYGLKWSWALFGAAIVCTLVSFMTSQEATRSQHEETSGGMRWRSATIALNIASAATFLVAVVLTVTFAIVNV